MGLFISHCPKCDRGIEWFLEAPKHHVCSCGYVVSKKEIEDSFFKNTTYPAIGDHKDDTPN